MCSLWSVGDPGIWVSAISTDGGRSKRLEGDTRACHCLSMEVTHITATYSSPATYLAFKARGLEV